jgi:flagellar motility protein MotE (MotC chaperone)
VKQKRIHIAAIALAGALVLMPFQFITASAQNEAAPAEAAKESAPTTQQPINATRAAREEKALQDARRQQLAEKEAALAAKEQELKKLSTKLEAQVKSLEESKKRLDDSMKVRNDAQKKKQDEKIMKMVKLFKTMKSEQAGKMIDTLKEDNAVLLLSRLDTKTVAKLVPFISQPRILKWVSDNLQEK